MKKPDTSIIDQPWPERELEYVERCPYCNSTERTLAYKDVQDWSFYCAPGKWTYWDCQKCQSLYLDPRPTKASIGAAYGSYYTHKISNSSSMLALTKDIIRNECWSQLLNVSIQPRLGLPRSMGWLLSPISSRLTLPFGLRELAQLPKGSLIDVGCGNGNTVSLAQQLGWQASGLEIDPAAASVGKARGLNVIEGTYEKLAEYPNQFDCIICSHVLEHVHDPVSMLQLLAGSLKKEGTLLLSLPNSTSYLRHHFGENWRGLEAPRHIALPSIEFLEGKISAMGFSVKQVRTIKNPTEPESLKIQKSRWGKVSTRKNEPMTKKISIDWPIMKHENSDFIQLVCRRNPSEV